MSAALVADRLRHGINLSHWYGQVYMEPGYVPAHFDTYMTDADLDLIATTGFDHVRFPIALERMTTGDGRALDEDFVGRIEREIARLHERGLTVVVDMHPENEYKDALAADDGAAAAFVAFWSRLAGRLSAFDPAATVLEVLNEPGLGSSRRWGEVLVDSVAAIRAAAPEHTILVSGDHYSEVPRLLELPDLDDDNLVYNIHLYDPHAWTHQGAGWSPAWVQQTRGLSYPVDADNVQHLLSAADDPDAISALIEYRAGEWSRQRYEQLLLPAVEFARTRGVPLTCNEFGVYKDFAPRAARLRWLDDITGLFREHGVGWTAWDYAGDFAVAVGEPGARVADDDVARALGLVQQ